MKTVFAASFERDLKSIRQRHVRDAVRAIISAVEGATCPAEIAGLKKLKAAGSYFRLRIGDYRLGLVIDGDTVKFVRILHRGEIYRYFP